MAPSEGIVELVDRAYQAAAEPSLWPETLAAMGQALGGHQSAVLVHKQHRVERQEFVHALADATAVPLYLEAYEDLNPLQVAIDRAYAGGFAPAVSSDQTYMLRGDLEASGFYNDYLRRFDMDHVMFVSSPGAATLNVLRGRGQGEFDARHFAMAQALQPSFDRAQQLTHRLQTARAVNEGLASFAERALGAVILADAEGRIVHANAAAESMLARADGVLSRAGILGALNADAGRKLAALIVGAAAAGADGPTPDGAVALPRRSGERALAALVTPARSEAGGEGPRLALISIVDPEQGVTVRHERLQAIFGLTVGEARALAALASGLEPKAIAAHLGVSVNTIRVQLARAKAKTETSRQSDLVSLAIRTAGQA